MKIERYGIYWADLNPVIGSEIAKVRPVVVVSQNAMNRHLSTIVACPLTSRLHPEWRSRFQISCQNRPAEIVVDQIRTLSKQRLTRKLDHLSADDAASLRRLIIEMYATQ